jgi:isopenicillin N synthase-like dioxygenase
VSGYFVRFEPEAVNALLAVERLSSATFHAVLAAVAEELGQDADYFARRYQTGHEAYTFDYHYPHQDEAAGCQFNFDFLCNGSSMAQGVVRVVELVRYEIILFTDPH